MGGEATVDEALAFVARVQPETGAAMKAEDGEIQRAVNAMVAEMQRTAGDFSRAWLEGLVLKGRLLEAQRRAPALRMRLFELVLQLPKPDSGGGQKDGLSHP